MGEQNTRIDADFLLARVEREPALRDRAEFVVRLKVGPAPDAAVDDVRQSLPVRHLQTSVERARDRHALARAASTRVAQRALQCLQRACIRTALEYTRSQMPT